MWPEVLCPEDGQSLDSTDGELVCSLGHHWRKDSGIPRMISQSNNYADAFGLQWKIYRQTQLDSYTKTTPSLDRAHRCLGEECWKLLHDRQRSDVLEVGCGAGRFTEVLLSTGAYVTSVDLSSAVEANQENFPQDQYHRILQADVLRLLCTRTIRYSVLPGCYSAYAKSRRHNREVICTSKTRRLARYRPLYL